MLTTEEIRVGNSVSLWRYSSEAEDKNQVGFLRRLDRTVHFCYNMAENNNFEPDSR